MKQSFTILLLMLLVASVSFAQRSEQKIVKENVIKSAVKSPNSPTATVYDFTTGSDKFYGGASGAIEVEAGVWGMIAGDSNGSGIISNSDKDDINTNNNLSGYYASDINLSGIVSNSDKDYVNSNNNKSTQVP